MTNKGRPELSIPDHEVYRKIGGGAYGEVWLARGVTGALRAVKVVWHDDFDDERGFEREFEGIEKYEPVSRDHPGLVNILHVGRGESDGEAFYYYVMELGDDVVTGTEINPVEYEARTLRSDMLSAEGAPLDVDLCIEVGRALAESLDHLHKAGLAHRDVKPANVIFVGGKAKLADIGLVALRDQRTFVGTEGFVPPEGPGSAQADVYSLGKVLYEMATGKDRLDFPELPDELPHGKTLKRWRALNGLICDICEPRLSKREIKTAGELAREMERLQRGGRRPLRISRGVGITLLGVAAVAGLAWQLPRLVRGATTTGEGGGAPVETVQDVYVTVTSTPLGAEVYDSDGNYLADTPLRPRKFPLGAEVEYTFRLDRYHSETIKAEIDEATVAEGGLVIAPVLSIYAPPVEGDPWEDVLGMTYQGIDDYHVGNYYIGREQWRAYREATGDKNGVFVEVSEKGVTHEAVFCGEEDAGRFADWLMKRSQDGYLTVDHVMVPRVDHEREFQGLSGDVMKRGLRPFRMVVHRIPYARLMITSAPTGADVYLDDKWQGVTPLLGEPVGSGIKVSPGMVEVVLEREGYEPTRKELSLANDEVWTEPVHFVLRESGGVVFDREWTNGLGMRFAPVNEELMASIWETRVKDYQTYVREADYNRPRKPDFAQSNEHPVVYVSPEDARKFCQWLTKSEQDKGLIAKNHRYRLPSDLEWSEMVGLSREAGDWPVERGDPFGEGYPWGEWPPVAGSGNYSDETAVTEGAQPITKSIPEYDDGHAFTSPVGKMKPNALGIHDLGGNVHEWVDGWYTSGEQFSVARGGGWNSYQSHTLLSSFRNAVDQTAGGGDNIYGFRVVLAKEALEVESGEEEMQEGEAAD